MSTLTFLVFDTELINLDHIYEIDVIGDENGYQAQFYYVEKDVIKSKAGKIYKTVIEAVSSIKAIGIDLKIVEMEHET